MLSSRHMGLARPLLATFIIAVVILGPTLFMASSPCVDCDGVCGASATFAPVSVPAVLLAVPLTPECRTQVFSTPHRPSELPPRPLPSTV